MTLTDQNLWRIFWKKIGYYLIEWGENFEIPDGEFIFKKDNCNVLIGWMPIDEIFCFMIVNFTSRI